MEYKLQSWETLNIRDYKTRKISRGYNEILLEWSTVWADGNISVQASNSDKANDYLVREMTWLNQEEVDNLSDKDFRNVLEKINSEETPS